MLYIIDKYVELSTTIRQLSIMTDNNSIYFKIPKTESQGFFLQYDDMPHFYDHLHHHPELQLAYILEGTGDLFIGDSITSFSPGDLFLIGSNQSHLFKSDSAYFEKDSDKKSQSIAVFFHEQSLGDGFFEISEMSLIRHLIERANRGIKFSSDVAESIGPRMEQLLSKSGFPRFIEIISILYKLAESGKYEYMAEVSSPHPPSDQESKRANDVINYILTHYKEDIELKTIAGIANYSKAAFCRFFKQRTRKTFSQFLNEVRISHACKLLRKTDLNISQICYESGYNNISNFNRQFKKNTGLTPREYVQKYEQSFNTTAKERYPSLQG